MGQAIIRDSSNAGQLGIEVFVPRSKVPDPLTAATAIITGETMITIV